MNELQALQSTIVAVGYLLTIIYIVLGLIGLAFVVMTASGIYHNRRAKHAKPAKRESLARLEGQITNVRWPINR